jgi:ATP-dependent protease Clp ATPase subunit
MLVAGPSVYICDECVDVCVDIIAKNVGAPARPEIQNGALSKDAAS